MSKIQVDTIVNNNDDGAPTFTMGAGGDGSGGLIVVKVTYLEEY
jgi:hypothetical protein